MWCNIDKTNFPIIKISFNAEKQIESEFDEFLQDGLNYMTKKKNFILFSIHANLEC